MMILVWLIHLLLYRVWDCHHYTFELPGYTIYDAAVWYYVPVGAGKKLRLQGGIKNLTDKTYYPANGSGNTYRSMSGIPARFI